MPLRCHRADLVYENAQSLFGHIYSHLTGIDANTQFQISAVS